MNKITPRVIKDPEKKRDIIGWLNLADDDYLSARVLIDNGMLVQGAIFSATSVEKYLKMIGEIHDVKFLARDISDHNVLGLYKTHKSNGASFDLNEDYLKFLVKIYKFRYPDKIKPNFNFAINQTKLMVALDESVYILRNRLQLINDKGEEQKDSRIHTMVDLNDIRLLRANHAFGKAKRGDLFLQPSIWHEMRFVNGETWLEAHYTAKVQDDREYDLEGMKPGDNDRQFKLRSEPIDLVGSNKGGSKK